MDSSELCGEHSTIAIINKINLQNCSKSPLMMILSCAMMVTSGCKVILKYITHRLQYEDTLQRKE